MSVKAITRHSKPRKVTTARDDWARFDSLTDDQIRDAIRRDPDAAPMLTPEWMSKARLFRPPKKEMISIRLDKDVLDYFRSEERWQTRINTLLRMIMEQGKPRSSLRQKKRAKRRR